MCTHTVSPPSLCFGKRSKTPPQILLNHKLDPKHSSINKGPLRCLSSLFPSSPLPPSNYQKPCHSAAAMLSTLSSSDPFLANPFSAFAGSFSPWDCPDPFPAFKPTSPKPVTSSSGSDNLNQAHEESNPNHGDAPSNQDRDASVVDERKRRRMISNRESARRSRMRKQRHLENLRNQLNRRRVENRELSSRLQFILHHLNRVQTENEWLRSERAMLRQKLSNFTHVLVFQQLQPFDPTTCMAMQ